MPVSRCLSVERDEEKIASEARKGCPQETRCQGTNGPGKRDSEKPAVRIVPPSIAFACRVLGFHLIESCGAYVVRMQNVAPFGQGAASSSWASDGRAGKIGGGALWLKTLTYSHVA
jgi:hypothetical protein